MVKTNQDISDRECIRNSDGLLAGSNEHNKIVCKSYYGKPLNSLPQAITASGIPHLVDKDMIRDSISYMKNGKAAGLFSVVVDDIVFELYVFS